MNLQKLSYTDYKKIFIGSVALFIGTFELYTMLFGQPSHMFFRPLLLSCLMSIGILNKPLLEKSVSTIKRQIGIYIDWLILAVLMIVQLYVMYDIDNFILRQGGATELDGWLGLTYVIIVLELARRYCGWVLCGLATFFFLQTVFSDHLFWIFYGPPVPLFSMVEFVFMRDEGLFSTPLMSILSYVVPFIIFTTLLLKSGAGDVFMNLALSVAGRLPGGPAKVAIISSALMGTISGSAVANVVGSGSVTIPLMKKTGYRPAFAGAVESVASTGGQIMPPVMGAAAFIVAQNLMMPYIELAVCAIIPALLYYVALYFTVHQEAMRLGLRGVPAESIPSFMETFKKGWSVIIPLIVIVALMTMGYTPIYAALYAIVLLFILVMINPKMRLSPEKFIDALQTGATNCVATAIGCAAAGLIIAGINISGAGLKFAGLVTVIAGGKLWLALILTMIVAIILGMGVPTTAVYVTVSVLLSPALIKMGVIPLAAHFFPFYYGVLAAITPPVALASYAAAGLAGSGPSETGWVAVRLGLTGFIIPYMFVYGPQLLMQGTALEIMLACISGSIGCYCLSGTIIGVINSRTISYIERGALFVGALLMIKPGLITDAVGIALICAVHLLTARRPMLNVENQSEEVA